MKNKQLPRIDNKDCEYIIVVGNKFGDFQAKEPGVYIVVLDTAIDMLKDGVDSNCCFIPGQGLSQESESLLFRLAREAGVMDLFNIWGTCYERIRSESSLSHKHRSKNQLLSPLRKTDNGYYVTEVLIDDANDIMADHTTGKHLQGMLLIEASRQLFISVGEKYYAGNEGPDRGTYIIDNMHIDFVNFAFPIPMLAQLKVNRINRKNKRKASFDTEIEFIQNNAVVAKIKIGFTMLDSVVFHKTEKIQAKSTIVQLKSHIRKVQDEKARKLVAAEAYIENPYAELNSTNYVFS